MLYGFDVPTDLVTTSGTPRLSNTARIGPPAMIPVPAGAERTVTLPAPKWPLPSWCSVRPSRSVNADHRLLRRSSGLGDRLRHFARLAVAEAGAALAVADHHQRREAEALAALHRLRDAVDVDELFDQLLAARRRRHGCHACHRAGHGRRRHGAARHRRATTTAARGPRPARCFGRSFGSGFGREVVAGTSSFAGTSDRLSPPSWVTSGFRLAFRTPVRLRGRRRRGPSPGHGTGSRRGRTRRATRRPSWRARQASCRRRQRHRGSPRSCP